MPERLPDLRQVLTESLAPERLTKDHAQYLERRTLRAEERKKLKVNLKEEQERINKFRQQYHALLESFATMTEDEFAITYKSARKEVEEINKRLFRISETINQERLFALNFVDVSAIHNLNEFVEGDFPLQFVPSKEEVGRIVALAKNMHARRADAGEIDIQEPIRVLDIGGSNGTLGVLVTEIARENNLDIQYRITDPDSLTVREAAAQYKANTNLEFVEKRSDDLVAQQYESSPRVSDLLKKRQVLIQQGQRQVDDLKTTLNEMLKWDQLLNGERIGGALELLKKNFNINVPAKAANTATDFLSWVRKALRGGGTEQDPSQIERLTECWNKRISKITSQIEQCILETATRYDLVINSWMPRGIDFTKDVREANGAAIIYMLGWQQGSTGQHESIDRLDASLDIKVGEEWSYNGGMMYEQSTGWIGHSSMQVAEMLEAKQQRFWEYRGTDNHPFENGFVVQVKKIFADAPVNIDPDANGVKVSGQYPWDNQLKNMGGGLSPVVPLSPDSGYFLELRDLKDSLQAKLDKQFPDLEQAQEDDDQERDYWRGRF